MMRRLEGVQESFQTANFIDSYRANSQQNNVWSQISMMEYLMGGSGTQDLIDETFLSQERGLAIRAADELLDPEIFTQHEVGGWLGDSVITDSGYTQTTFGVNDMEGSFRMVSAIQESQVNSKLHREPEDVFQVQSDSSLVYSDYPEPDPMQGPPVYPVLKALSSQTSPIPNQWQVQNLIPNPEVTQELHSRQPTFIGASHRSGASHLAASAAPVLPAFAPVHVQSAPFSIPSRPPMTPAVNQTAPTSNSPRLIIAPASAPPQQRQVYRPPAWCRYNGNPARKRNATGANRTATHTTDLIDAPPVKVMLPQFQMGIVELFSYFPRHYLWNEILLRALASEWSTKLIAFTMLNARGRVSQDGIRRVDQNIRKQVVHAGNKYFNLQDQDFTLARYADRMKSATFQKHGYDVSHIVPRERTPSLTDMKLVDLHNGVTPPMGHDRGVFTQCVIWAAVNDHAAKISDVARIAQQQGFAAPQEANGSNWDIYAKSRMQLIMNTETI